MAQRRLKDRKCKNINLLGYGPINVKQKLVIRSAIRMTKKDNGSSIGYCQYGRRRLKWTPSANMDAGD